MTINVSVGEGGAKYRVERWVPEKDEGAGFTPGAWVLEDAGTISPNGTFSHAGGPGWSVSIWRDAEDPPAAA